MGRGALFVGFVLIAMVGCEAKFWISRAAVLGGVPAPECVQMVIERAQDLSIDEYWEREESLPTGVSHALIFSARLKTRPDSELGIDGSIDLTMYADGDGKGYFAQRWARVNRAPNQGDARRIVELMRTVERQVESVCEVDGLVLSIEQRCRNVRCPEPKTGAAQGE